MHDGYISSFLFFFSSNFPYSHLAGRLPSDVFSQGKNERFAGTQVNPNQMAMMSTQVKWRYDEQRSKITILRSTPPILWGYSSTCGREREEFNWGIRIQSRQICMDWFRVCCDAVCPFETELGVKKGSRNWQPREVICPKGTRQAWNNVMPV